MHKFADEEVALGEDEEQPMNQTITCLFRTRTKVDSLGELPRNLGKHWRVVKQILQNEMSISW
jgi:hypothetical protein